MAKDKGYNFWVWWIIGSFLFPIALIGILILDDKKSVKSSPIKNIKSVIENNKAAKKYFDILNMHFKRKKFTKFNLSVDDEILLIESHYHPKAIKSIVYKIFSYLNLKYEKVDVVVNKDIKETEKHAGFYHKSFSSINIIINIKESYSFAQIMAIICHECMHHSLYQSGLYLSNEHENELLTDYSTIYFGFDKYMIKGYKTEKIHNRTEKIGYINEFNIKAMLKVIDTFVKTNNIT